jgi:hypothetical protein
MTKMTDVDVFINSKRRIPMPSYFKYQQVTDDEAINEDGTLRDGHCVRVSMQDAQKIRAERQQLSDAEQRVQDYMAYHKAGAGHRPGFRTLANDPEYRDNRIVADAAYDAVEKAQAEAWRTLGGSNTQSRGRAFTGQRGSKPGDPCSIDGASGVLGYNAEGELVCQVQSSNDDPEKALSDACQDHINYLNHAWRQK